MSRKNCSVKEKSKDNLSGPDKIRITVHTPEKVNERIRRQKINQIYDILCCK